MMNKSRSLPGLILAGGLSRRMGTNKALCPFGERQLLHHVIDKIAAQVSALALNTRGEWGKAFDLPLVPDTKIGHAGPLAGVLAGLQHFQKHPSGASHMLTVPSDSPFFPDDLALRLMDHLPDENTIVIAASKGQVHPVFALWPLALANDLEQWLADDDNRRIRSFLARHATIGVSFPPVESSTSSIDPFFNINTPEELAQAQNFLKSLTQ
ncbi:molybdopterin-guanine dinucleotide biosynthesis protein A [Agrobacterium larrymoorei]|uniref:Molybdenum cofactor guanylyltransferase n=2 Tax=Agrobacterium larrymoorei TaxID=160699 RepID=A0AAJ2EQR6_9HYPH|nr:molybdopterin-guanine dinucleotide biosynthesis protein A [Agrobacterium larrymoorei]